VYVCLCNGFTDTQVRTVLEQQGCGSTAQVYSAMGCRPKCGRCVPEVRRLMSANAERSPGLSNTGTRF
jgi:bacterioferritin-associated ferredoxin